MTPQLLHYRTDADLPDYFRYQVHAFMRIEWAWSDGDDYDMDAPIEGDDLRPQHVVLARGKTLIAFATVVHKTLAMEGQPLVCYGLANVLTYPHFRGRGYGGQVVKQATAIIHSAPDADIALLWRAEANNALYARHGWEPMPGLTTLTGDPHHPAVYDDEGAMMLFRSRQGQQARPLFEHGRVYVGAWTW